MSVMSIHLDGCNTIVYTADRTLPCATVKARAAAQPIDVKRLSFTMSLQ